MEKRISKKIKQTIIILKKIDLYIIKKFLSTYLLSITLILLIAIVFDFSEKIDNFIDFATVSATVCELLSMLETSRHITNTNRHVTYKLTP